jgi:hypothetical protein
MIKDAGLEYNKQWKAIADEGIGGPVPYVAPTTYTVVPASPSSPEAIVTIAGKGYTDMMAATHRPLMPAFFPNEIYYSLEFNISTDDNAPTKAQALESEAVYCHLDDTGKCWYYNNSLQFNYQEGGMIQVFTPTNPWLDTGIKVPKFTPNLPCPVKISYLVDTVNHVMSTQAVMVNGVSHALPASCQKLPGVNKSPIWAPGVYVQFQLDLAFAGGTFVNKYSGVGINWE